MYRTYHLTDKEDGKIVRCRWDGDAYSYDVFDTQEECDEEERRLAKIDEEWKRKKEEYYNLLEREGRH